jgi:ribosomal-protein-alanine N-acetyltransferase
MHSFTTERLLIRPLQTEDEAFFCRQFTNEKVMRHTGGTLSLEDANKAFQRSLRANERAINDGNKSVLTWARLCLNTETIIGTQTLSFLIRPHNKKIIQQAEESGIKHTEIGIMLSPSANGKLFPEEAMGALMEYAFTQLSICRINAFYDSKNIATKRFVNKLGFSEVKTLSDNYNAANLKSDNHTTNIPKTHYQYFDNEHWQQQLIIKLFPLLS